MRGVGRGRSGAKRALSLSSPASAVILRRTINASRLIYFLYQVCQIALSPAVALYLLYRGIRDRRYFSRLTERLGLLPRSLPGSIDSTGAGSIWFHAVSVGEVLSTMELIKQVRLSRPRVAIFVSTTTLAGRAMADQKLAGLADGIFFAPLDYRSMVRRVLRRLRPAVVVVLETEIWPNLVSRSKTRRRVADDREWPNFRSRAAALCPLELVLPARPGIRGCDSGAERGGCPAFRDRRRGSATGTGGRKFEV